MTDIAAQPPNPSPAPAAPQPAEALGARVGHGMAWIVFVTIANKGLTSIAQIVLGWKLDAADFSVFAVATGIAGFIMVCKEAGMRELVVQRGKDQYEQIAGPTFWLAFWYNVIVAAIIAALAYPLSAYLNKPSFALVIIVLGIALPIGTTGGMLLSKVRIDLDFARGSKISFWSNLLRQLSCIAFAFAGMGSMALALPAVVAAAAESIMYGRTSKIKLWREPAKTEQWPALLRDSRWLMFASVANIAIDWAPFVVLMPLGLLSATQNGLFYFGYQITAQVGVMLGMSVLLVLMPALTRLNADPIRQGQAVMRSLRTLMLVASIASLGLAACMPALESLLWRGKWQDVVPATILLGIFFPWRITFGLTAALLMAQGRSKLYSMLTLFEGVGLTISCCVAALIEPTATSVALGAGLWLFISRAAICLWITKQLGLPRRKLAIAMSSSWCMAILAGAAGWAADHYTNLRALLPQHIPIGSDATKLMLTDAVRLGLAGSVTALVFLVLARLFLHEALRDVVLVAPVRLRSILGLICGVQPHEKSPDVQA